MAMHEAVVEARKLIDESLVDERTPETLPEGAVWVFSVDALALQGAGAKLYRIRLQENTIMYFVDAEYADAVRVTRRLRHKKVG